MKNKKCSEIIKRNTGKTHKDMEIRNTGIAGTILESRRREVDSIDLRPSKSSRSTRKSPSTKFHGPDDSDRESPLLLFVIN